MSKCEFFHIRSGIQLEPKSTNLSFFSTLIYIKINITLCDTCQVINFTEFSIILIVVL